MKITKYFDRNFAVAAGLATTLFLTSFVVVFIIGRVVAPSPAEPNFDAFNLILFLINVAVVLIGGYLLVCRRFQKDMARPKYFAKRVVGALIAADALFFAASFGVIAALSRIWPPVELQSEIPASGPMPIVAIFVTISFLLLPYVALKWIVYLFARNKAEQARQELFN